MTLPKLVFCESHNNPGNKELLTNLATKLKRLGYETFFAEMPSNIVLDDYYQKKFKVSSQTKTLLNRLSDLSITYHSIDLAILHKIELALGPYASIYNFWSELTDIRDKKLISSYLNCDTNVFGWCGIKHARGMQKWLLNWFGDEAKDQFIFFYTHSNTFEESLNIPHQEYIKNIFPLGMNYIDLTSFDLNKFEVDLQKKCSETIKDFKYLIDDETLELEAYNKIEHTLERKCKDPIIKKIMQSLINSRNLSKTVEDGVLDILNYISKREWDDRNYFSKWGSFFGYLKETKIKAALKLVDHLVDHPEKEAFTQLDFGALTSGRLGKKICSHPPIAALLKTYMNAPSSNRP